MRRNDNVKNIVSGYIPALQFLMEALQLSTYTIVTNYFFLSSVFNSIQTEDIKHVWYFELILEHIIFIW